MRIRFVLDLGNRRPTVVQLQCPTGTTLGAAWAALTEACLTPGLPLEGTGVDGEPTSPESEIGLPPLLDGAVISRVGVAQSPPATMEVCIVAGPDAGGRHPLHRNSRIVGRSATADIRITDRSLSRRHCAVDVHGDSVWLTDLGSANGTSAPGQVMTPEGCRIRIGEPFRLGDTTLVVRSTPNHPAIHRRATRGRLLVTTGTGRPRLEVAPETIRVPAPPAPAARWPLSSLVVGLPAAASVVTGFVMGSPVMAVVGAIAFLAWVLQLVVNARGTRKHDAGRERSHRAKRALAAARIRTAVDHERSQCARRLPDLATVLEIATGNHSAVWSRRPSDAGAFLVRVGIGVQRSQVTIAEEGSESWHPAVADCPVGLDVAQGPTGVVAADRDQLLSCARSIILQLITWHSPRNLAVCVVVARDESLMDWEWLKWPAHSRRPGHSGTLVYPLSRRPGSVVAQLLSQRGDGPDPGAVPEDETATLLVVDGSLPPGHDPALDAATRSSGSGMSLWLTHDKHRLPGTCPQLVRLSARGGTLVTSTGKTQHFRPDGLGAELAADAGRSLAALTPETAERNGLRLADDISLTGELGLPPLRPDPAKTEESWVAWMTDMWRARHDRTDGLPMTIGVCPAGPLVIDLVADGPHALIAGTTGSGKSELLRAVVASLAATNSPTELTFVLVDFKGGAAFRSYLPLPHVAGLLTDLEEDQTSRALAGLRAEIRRREAILQKAGVDDVRYLPAGAARSLSVPRLVIVVDEFRALAEDKPEVLAGLVRVASQGRSLGIHLILATQRPAGIVSGEIRANTGLRIALRMTDRADSFDVIDSDAASHLPPGAPGRALLRRSDGQLTEVQVGRLAWHPKVRSAQITAVALPWPEPAADALTGADDCLPCDAQRLVNAARTAAERLHLPAVRPPWTPQLPRAVTVTEVSRDYPLTHYTEATTCCSPGGPLTLGLAEDLDAQKLYRLTWHPQAAGHLAVCGPPGSGRTTFLETLLDGVWSRWCPGRLEVYLLDPGAGLSSHSSRPQVLGYAGPGDKATAGRIVDRLVDRAERGRPGPALSAVLVVDGWEALASFGSDPDPTRLEDDIVTLLRAGDRSGVRVVVSGLRSPLLPPLAGMFRDRVALGGLDCGDLLLAGVPQSLTGGQRANRVAGRGWHLPPGHTCQIALPAPRTGSTAFPDTAQASIPEPGRGLCRPSTPRLSPLPSTVRLRDLPDLTGPRTAGMAVPIGVTAEGQPAVLHLAEGAVLIAGQRRSGRTNALVTIAAGLAGACEVVLLTGKVPGHRSGLPAHVTLLGLPEAAALCEILDRNPGVALLCDDAEAFEDTLVEPLLLAHCSRTGLDRGPCVLTTTSAHAVASYRGPIGLLRRNGRGLILRPGRREDEVFSRPLRCADPKRPGLAVQVDEDRVRVLQVALADFDADHDHRTPTSTPQIPTAAAARTSPPISG